MATNKKEAGRPSKLTPATKQKLLDAVALGSTYTKACYFAGITYATFRAWMIRGEAQKTGIYKDFFDEMKAAEGTAAVGFLANIVEAANKGDWKAAAWLLERRYPKEYGRRSIVEINEAEIKEEYNAILEALTNGGIAVEVKKGGAGSSAPSKDFPN